MNPGLARHPVLERRLAMLLQYGTWLASGVIALGFALALAAGTAGGYLRALPSGMHVVTAGIALLILLPILRVALMLIVFILDRDYRFGAIAAVVLAMILMGMVVGIVM